MLDLFNQFYEWLFDGGQFQVVWTNHAVGPIYSRTHAMNLAREVAEATPRELVKVLRINRNGNSEMFFTVQHGQ